MKPEDRISICKSCGLEVPYGMCNEETTGWCIECSNLRPMQRFFLQDREEGGKGDPQTAHLPPHVIPLPRPRHRGIVVRTGTPWTPGEYVLLGIAIGITISIVVIKFLKWLG